MVGVTRTATEFLALGLVLWLAIGVVLSIVMGRRGHNAFAWFFIGLVLGPLAIPIAWVAMVSEPGQVVRIAEGVPGTGTVGVLVGLDGSAQADSALRSAIGLLGSRIGRLTLAAVLEFDSSGRPSPGTRERMTGALERAAASVEGVTPAIVMLSGQPASALMDHAVAAGDDLVVVGSRGVGVSKALLGSTAMRLAHRTDVPVLIV